MKITDMDMIFNKPEGFFDHVYHEVDDEKSLWGPIHRLVIESNDIENYIIKQYARRMQKQTILKDINQEFTLGKRLQQFNSSSREEMHRLLYKEYLATKRRNPILDKHELNEEEIFLKQQQEMARAAEAIRKKDEVKSRYMHDKEINKEGKMLRYQVKSVKDSVKLKQMTVETGNQIILKYI